MFPLRILVVAGSLVAAPLHATLVTDYFEYGSTDGAVTGFTTSNTSGWAANAWSGSSGVIYSSTESLTFGGAGYTDSTAGGLLNADGSSGGDDIVTRSLSSAGSGTVWASALVFGEFWNASDNRMAARILVNGDAADSAGARSAGGNNFTASLIVNSVESTNSSVISSGTAGALFVVKMETNFSGTSDRISLWTIPYGTDLSGQNETALGTATLASDGTSDIWGDSVGSFGIALQSPNTDTREVFYDNLRISSGSLTDDQKVQEVLTGVAVPEPSTALLLGGGLAMLAISRRVRRG